ncbi:NERD domain-containing protein [Rhizobium calliandrae]|uniref:NERD domain-containing protein n=1 Tax=Rhizobium calliandrae TaxID=1312182 RepID=A0ABT7KL72_9HYPH|nr:NERD domain-containing protein [Rhizobium calliandrae]MDL2409166.1 NERD domain-containing protein [Rhizobium calliandrae]
MTSDGDNLKQQIFIGDAVTNGSDQHVLIAVAEYLEKAGARALIFANLNLGGRQIDTIVVTEQLVLVLEAKGYRRPLRGGANGHWQVRVAGGEWKSTRNAYHQASGAALALRDTMRAFDGAEVPYLDTAVVFDPAIPAGSELTSDFKVKLLGLADLSAELAQTSKNPWSLDRWTQFARHLRLVAVGDAAAACDPSLARSETLLGDYSAGVARLYQPLTLDAVTSSWTAGGEPISSDELTRRIASGRDACLIGPSGCGKSLGAYVVALRFAATGGIPLVVAAKNFVGSMSTLLDGETQLIADTAAREVVAAAKQLNRPLLLVIDGFNECSEPLRVALLRRIAAFGRRYEAHLVITSQNVPERADLLSLDTFDVPRPSLELKLSIATQASGAPQLPAGATELLSAVESCLEARLVGQLGDKSGTASRFDLFDRFVRARLGDQATAGVARLSVIARWMMDRITFSFALRELERTGERADRSVDDRLLSSKLLSLRGDRVSFGHDLFLDAYAAEAVVREAGGSASAILTSLAEPRHKPRKELILGAITDPLLLEQVLAGLEDAELILACLVGRCGRAARDWAEALAEVVFGLIAVEIDTARLELGEGHMWKVGFEPSNVVWTRQQRAVLHALPSRIAGDVYVERLVELAGRFDKRLVDETFRLREEAAAHKIAVRTGAFAAAYVNQTSEALGIT